MKYILKSPWGIFAALTYTLFILLTVTSVPGDSPFDFSKNVNIEVLNI